MKRRPLVTVRKEVEAELHTPRRQATASHSVTATRPSDATESQKEPHSSALPDRNRNHEFVKRNAIAAASRLTPQKRLSSTSQQAAATELARKHGQPTTPAPTKLEAVMVVDKNLEVPDRMVEAARIRGRATARLPFAVEPTVHSNVSTPNGRQWRKESPVSFKLELSH